MTSLPNPDWRPYIASINRDRYDTSHGRHRDCVFSLTPTEVPVNPIKAAEIATGCLLYQLKNTNSDHHRTNESWCNLMTSTVNTAVRDYMMMKETRHILLELGVSQRPHDRIDSVQKDSGIDKDAAEPTIMRKSEEDIKHEIMTEWDDKRRPS